MISIKACLNMAGKGLLSLLLVPILNSAALAEGTGQLYICGNGHNAQYRPITAHDKRFEIGNTRRVVVLVDDGSNASGSSGFNIPLVREKFSFVSWFYKQAKGSRALQNVTVRYCFSDATGKSLGTFDVQGGSFDRGGQRQDGWSEVLQDNRVFGGEILRGNAFIDRICFIFNGNGNPSNITIGDVRLPNSAATALNMTVGGCEVPVPCPLTGI